MLEEHITKYKDLQLEYFDLVANIESTKDRVICAKVLFNLYNQNFFLKEMAKQASLTEAAENKIAANVELIAAIKGVKKFI